MIAEKPSVITFLAVLAGLVGACGYVSLLTDPQELVDGSDVRH